MQHQPGVTEAQRQFYQQHGWVVLRGLLNRRTISAAVRTADDYYSGSRDRELPIKLDSCINWEPKDGAIVRINSYVAYTSDFFRSLVMTSRIGEAAATLTGVTEIRLFESSLTYKPIASADCSTRIGWHTEKAYWRTCSSENMLTFWLPLVDCDATNGGLVLIDGSHRWHHFRALRELQEVESFYSDNFSSFRRRVGKAYGETIEVSPTIRAGDCVVLHCRTLHASHANRSNRPRVALSIFLQDGDNVFVPHLDEEGEQPAWDDLDSLVRRTPAGVPDYSDPDFCPVLFRAETTD